MCCVIQYETQYTPGMNIINNAIETTLTKHDTIMFRNILFSLQGKYHFAFILLSQAIKHNHFHDCFCLHMLYSAGLYIPSVNADNNSGMLSNLVKENNTLKKII